MRFNSIAMKKLIFIMFLLGYLFPLGAQDLQFGGIRVLDTEGQLLTNPWAGGMETPHYSAAELTGDGRKELVSFDRADKSFMVFRNVGEDGIIRYIFDEALSQIFRACDCEGWALLRDFDRDGRQDVFCGTPLSSVRLYRQNEDQQFELFIEELETTIFNTQPLNVNKIDVPAIIDIDRDGDLDIFTFGLASNFLEFHRNFATEETGRQDTIMLKAETICWGHFMESDTDNTAFINDTLNCPLGDFRPQRIGLRHTGSTTLLLDLNADSTYDALIGDVSFNEIYALYNGGTSQYAYIDSVERNFPQSSIPVNVSTFPAAYYHDINNDEKRDLLVAPHAASSYDNVRGTHIYINTGLDDAPSWEYRGGGFLQDGMIDVGSVSYPAFGDVDMDGQADLVIGNRGEFEAGQPNLQSGLVWYSSSMEGESLVFRQESVELLDIDNNPVLNNVTDIRPALGDLDGDGDDDLLVGNAFGDLIYFEQIGDQERGPLFSFRNRSFEGIDVGWYSAPLLFDIDGDLDLDLFIGNRSGTIHFYRNTGNSTSFSFELVTEKWGNIEVKEEPENPFSFGFAQPAITDLDQDGDLELLVGSINGQVDYFDIEPTAETFPPLGQLEGIHVRRNSAPAVYNLNNSPPFILSGNARGGLKYLSLLPVSNSPQLSLENNYLIYPNPFNNSFSIQQTGTSFSPFSYQLFDLQSKLILQSFVGQSAAVMVPISLPRGYYMLRIEDARGVTYKKINKY